jgi:mercuric reductase
MDHKPMKDCCEGKKPAGYDLLVSGAGSAGFSAAITAAKTGAKVLIIGHGTIGGTCVNVGCVPSKAMIRAVGVLHNARMATRFDGITVHGEITDWAAMVRQKQALVDDLRAAKYTGILPNYPNVDYIAGAAEFNTDGSISVGDQHFSAASILIATGSRSHVPDIAGLAESGWLDSTSALELETLPKSLMVMGGGFIGVELAQIFARAGVGVTIVTRHGLLPAGEPEISAALTKYFAQEGITVLDGLSYQSIRQQGDQVILSARHNGQTRQIHAERLLLATGRVPNTDSLALNRAGIDTDARGGVITDAHMQTTRPGIFAAGDVTGRDQFVYMAAYGAKIAALNAVANAGLTYDNHAMPAVVFSDPQVASVGLTESGAQKAGHQVVTSVLPLEYVPRALAARDTRGLIKLVADKDSKKLLGAHILAPEGADSIQSAAMAIHAGLTYEQLGAMIFPYLTTVEGLKLAAQTFEEDVAKLSCCAG